MSGRKLARRACDGCKIRKVKCNEGVPCDGCVNAKIPCTWLKQSQPRGPRRLRDATYLEIRKAQQILQTQHEEATRKGTTRSANVQDIDPPPAPSAEISRLVLHLCVYRIQLYPIFPIIKVERLIASLQSETPDDEVYALAYALAAATAIRTRSTELSIPKKNHAQILESKCQAARSKVPDGRPPNLTTVRIAFFLHCYYDSLEANSMKSMLYLREAITIATMIGLHKEAYYTGVPPQERELRRRVLWLLFVRERQVSVLYDNTPITLRTKIELPSTTDTDEPEILLGFQILTKLIWLLDDRGMFEQLDELDVQASPASSVQSGSVQGDRSFSDLIETGATYIGYIPPIQQIDLIVTRAWLHIMNLRLLQSVSQQAVRRSLMAVFSSVSRMNSRLETCDYHSLEVQGHSLRLKLDVISGALQELINSHIDTNETRETCTNLITATQTIARRLSNDLPPRSPAQMVHGLTIDHRHSESSIDREWWPNQTTQSAWSPLSDNAAIAPGSANGPAYLHQDFAANNNYEGLFDAVQLEGVQSSDSVQDLFGPTGMDDYSNFEPDWPQNMRTDHTSHTSMFDFG